MFAQPGELHSGSKDEYGRTPMGLIKTGLRREWYDIRLLGMWNSEVGRGVGGLAMGSHAVVVIPIAVEVAIAKSGEDIESRWRCAMIQRRRLRRSYTQQSDNFNIGDVLKTEVVFSGGDESLRYHLSYLSLPSPNPSPHHNQPASSDSRHPLHSLPPASHYQPLTPSH